MGTRETAVSKSIEYDSAICTNCGDDVFIDSEIENVDSLPKGIPIVVTGGENMTVNTTSFTASNKNYRIPQTVVKIFGLQNPTDVEESYLCPACAEEIYDTDTDK
ncbi:hypothetical protein ACM16X_16340 [Haloarcula japonica]|uniref:hypothetical protein n=1 Tax=Haloarcula japonica TaxID=29282 RepID=UPI0039F6EB44